MNENKNTTNDVNFQEGYLSLPARLQKPVRDELYALTGWGYVTFYNKMRGRSRIYPAEVPVIEQVFHKHNIDPWTGKKTNHESF